MTCQVRLILQIRSLRRFILMRSQGWYCQRDYHKYYTNLLTLLTRPLIPNRTILVAPVKQLFNAVCEDLTASIRCSIDWIV